MTMPSPAPVAPTYYCPECDYNLTGITNPAYPECGEALDLENLHKPLIPWVHRQEIGRVRAYWQTVWMVMFQNRRLCREISKPVSYEDARQFRMVTIGGLCLVVLPVLVMGLWEHYWGFFSGMMLLLVMVMMTWQDIWNYFSMEIGLILTLAVTLSYVLFLFAATHAHTVWFHPRGWPSERQNRAIALSYYAVGPWSVGVLGYLAAFVLMLILHMVLAGPFSFALELKHQLLWLCWWAAITVMSTGILYAWTVPVRMARQIKPRSAWSQLLMLISLPALWVLQAVVVIGSISAVVIYIVISFFSLH